MYVVSWPVLWALPTLKAKSEVAKQGLLELKKAIA